MRRRAPAMSGINSRHQDTGRLLAEFGRPGVSGINSRHQDTGRLLAEFGQPGMGAIEWLAQGVALALASELIGAKKANPLQDEADRIKAARELNDPFTGAGRVGPGVDRTLVVSSSSLSGLSGMAWLGAYQSPGSTSAQAAAPPPIATSAGGAALTVASTAITSGSSLASGTTWLAAAGGPIGLAVAGVTVALTMLFRRKGPKQKVATSEIVDSVEPLLASNLSGFLSGPMTESSREQAIQNFDAAWQYVVDSCDIPEMGNPGQWCVNDRKAGGKWDWFARYLDPILNAQVTADPPVGMAVTIDPQTGERIAVPMNMLGDENKGIFLLAIAVAALTLAL